MSRRISADHRALKAAEAFCLRVDSPRAAVSRKVLAGLLASAGSSAAEIAKKAGCSRGYVFSVIKAVEDESFEQLAAKGPFQKKALLSSLQREELTGKLERGEFTCAKDVAKWFGESVGLSTVHGWCRECGYSFRKPGKSATQTSAVSRNPDDRLVLSGAEAEALRARQDIEREKLGLGTGELRDPAHAGNARRTTNPVLRLEAILRVGTTNQSVSGIAADLGTPRSEVRRWSALYRSKGLEVVCKVNTGGRPRTATAKPVHPPAGKLKQSMKSKAPDPEREAKEEFKATVIAQLEARQRALEEEAKARKKEVEKQQAQQAIEDEEWKSSPYYKP